VSEITQIRLEKNQAFNVFGHQTCSLVRAYQSMCSNDYLTPVGHCPPWSGIQTVTV